MSFAAKRVYIGGTIEQAPVYVVQRVDNFTQWISRYLTGQFSFNVHICPNFCKATHFITDILFFFSKIIGLCSDLPTLCICSITPNSVDKVIRSLNNWGVIIYFCNVLFSVDRAQFENSNNIYTDPVTLVFLIKVPVNVSDHKPTTDIPFAGVQLMHPLPTRMVSL